MPTPLTENREPDLGALVSATNSLARVLQQGQLVVLESTTYPGTTRERLTPLLEESGLAAGRDFNVAFSPERIDPGRTDYTLRNTPKVVGGLTDGLPRARDRAVRAGLRLDRPGLDARGRGAHEAAREHLQVGEHRARQRARDPVREHEDRRLGGRRGRGDQALRLHVVHSPGRGSAATACRSIRSTSPGARASSTSPPSSSSSRARSTRRCPTSASRRSRTLSTTARRR